MPNDIENIIKLIESASTLTSWVERQRSIVDFVRMLLQRHLEGKGISLSQSQIDRIIAVLEKLSDDPKWEIRSEIIKPLFILGNDRSKQIIKKLTEDNNAWVKGLAIDTLRKFPTRELTQPSERKDEISTSIFNLIEQFHSIPKDERWKAVEQIKEKAYKEIAGDIAHQLNNRLTSFNQNLEKLFEGISKSRTIENSLRPLIKMIKDSSSAFSALVDSLVKYSKRMDEPFQAVNLRSLLSETLSRAKSKCIVNKKLSASDVFEVDKLIQIDGHSDGLYEAFFNVICNALESMKEKSALTIRSQTIPDKESIKIVISDTGCGMTETQIEDSKKRYFSTKQGGIGLGLPIAIKIIETEHKGKLDITSQLNQGTTVTIELPQHQS